MATNATNALRARVCWCACVCDCICVRIYEHACKRVRLHMRVGVWVGGCMCVFYVHVHFNQGAVEFYARLIIGAHFERRISTLFVCVYVRVQVPVIATLFELGGRVVYQNKASQHYWGALVRTFSFLALLAFRCISTHILITLSILALLASRCIPAHILISFAVRQYICLGAWHVARGCPFWQMG